MAHVFISIVSVVDLSSGGHAVVLRDFRENGSRFDGRREIAQSRRSDADLKVSRNVWGSVLMMLEFFEPSRN